MQPGNGQLQSAQPKLPDVASGKEERPGSVIRSAENARCIDPGEVPVFSEASEVSSSGGLSNDVRTEA